MNKRIITCINAYAGANGEAPIDSASVGGDLLGMRAKPYRQKQLSVAI